ncbi:UDP-N-acetylglucosamine 2-epimerase [Helicobacter sp. 10-6591]|uniref:UDP-N-acetylglucosamine 2-epimerase n=1 Tax=Helicobacter sp. 10-6591 TaxID=2004998 RepID=UPI000DCD523A|nr:UDP-N-acetylglucosamine 2-epimerase [Helicobacter sp. 10-6591]RAX56299.1 UDP-N-acetylglucosamine 2-epimerase (hydrolyzing) [Helicobacter sp. 10-6591]
MKNNKDKKRIVFVTGTRADFSKLKSLMRKVEENENFELFVFVTGMHMSNYFGATFREVEKEGFKNIYKFINHDRYYSMDKALSTTIDGFSKFVAEIKPHLIIVHGDRIEPLAAASVGSLNNILVAHIEGGEISGTIDDSLRHATSKLAHIHLVNDQKAKKNLIQLGEDEKAIFIIGSPDLDILQDKTINIKQVKSYYEIPFKNYAIAMFHPVVTEFHSMMNQAKDFATSLIDSGKNYIVIYPNNDLGFECIIESYKAFQDNQRFRIFPSIRFEYFIALLKHADFIIGNSSCILKEAVFLGIQGINVGSRQTKRTGIDSVLIKNVPSDKDAILQAIKEIKPYKTTRNISPNTAHRSDELFSQLLQQQVFFTINTQKTFMELP